LWLFFLLKHGVSDPDFVIHCISLVSFCSVAPYNAVFWSLFIYLTCLDLPAHIPNFNDRWKTHLYSSWCLNRRLLLHGFRDSSPTPLRWVGWETINQVGLYPSPTDNNVILHGASLKRQRCLK